jgi:DNA-directed RNA polymerase specialized sigma24 family protein
MDTSNHNHEQWLTQLYLSVFPAVAVYIKNKGGTLDEAKDVFQDALVIYYEKAIADKVVIEHSEKAYLLGITKHLWYHHQQKQKGIVGEDVLDYEHLVEDDALTPSSHRLLRYLETAGQKCMDMLHAFYYDKLNMREIAERFNLAGERSATVQKHKCLEKVREKVKEKSLNYEDFCL